MKPEKLYLRTDYSKSIKMYVKKVSVSKDIWEEIGAFYSDRIITFEAENIIQYFNDCTQPTQEEIIYFEIIYGQESKDAFLVWLESYQHQQLIPVV